MKKRNNNIIFKSVADGIQSTSQADLISKWIQQNVFTFHEIGTGHKAYAHHGHDFPTLRISKTLVTSDSLADSTQAMRLDSIGELSHLNPSIAGLFETVHIDPAVNKGRVIRYLDRATVTRGAAAVDEGAAAPESASAWEEKVMYLQKVADSVPVTKEVFLDLDVIRKNINTLLDVNIKLKEDEYLWSGDGVATHITGVYTKAPAFAPGGYANQFTEVSLWDLLAVMRTSIMKNRRYVPDIAVIHPDDALTYKIRKASDGHYILPEGFKDLTILESSQVTQNTALVGDSRYGTLYDYETVIEAGFVDEGFTSDQLTIRATKYVNLLIRNVDQNAFLKVTDISQAIRELDSAVAD